MESESVLFPIIEVASDAPVASEEMGTKRKFWFHEPERGLCLYKEGRSGTGEDWSEKIAAELCQLLRLPHATYELAMFEGKNGTISPSFLPENGSLIPGNEVLVQLMPDYPSNIQEPSQHTISNVFSVVSKPEVGLPIGWTVPSGLSTAPDIFVGYLLLDAWIGNTDRHHENWAFVERQAQNYLAPTYDHASSLGRNESDTRRQERLTTNDRGFSVEAYTAKSRSCLYARVGETKPLTTLDAFREAAELRPQAAQIWLEQLSKVTTDDTQTLFERVPPHRISSIAIQFAQRILEINKKRLLTSE